MRAVTAAALAAGCFGGGGTPAPPADAVVAFAIPDTGNCASVGYIGDVSIQGSRGAAIVSANVEICDNGGGGPDGNVSLVEFSLDGTSSTQLFTGTAGGYARVGWVDGTPVMVYLGPSNPPNGVFLQAGSGSSAFLPFGMTNEVAPATAVVDPTTQTMFLALWQAQQGIPVFDDTDFVEGQQSAFNFQGGNPQQFGFAIVGSGAPVAFSTQEEWFCNSMPDCLAQNTASVFAMVRGTNGNGGNGLAYQIEQFPKATGSSDADFTVLIPSGQNNIGDQSVGPTGLAADDDHVVWTLAADLEDGQPTCGVFSNVVGSQAAVDPMTMLSTTAFSCAGAAVDGSAAYVAITKPVQINGNNGTELSGLGIARLGFDGSYASIATDITGEPYDGPRRVYILPGPPEQIVAVDPHAIGIIPVSAFDGRQDIPQ